MRPRRREGAKARRREGAKARRREGAKARRREGAKARRREDRREEDKKKVKKRPFSRRAAENAEDVRFLLCAFAPLREIVLSVLLPLFVFFASVFAPSRLRGRISSSHRRTRPDASPDRRARTSS